MLHVRRLSPYLGTDLRFVSNWQLPAAATATMTVRVQGGLSAQWVTASSKEFN